MGSLRLKSRRANRREIVVILEAGRQKATKKSDRLEK